MAKPTNPAPESEPEPTDEPASPPDPTEPTWATELKQLITDLPGKLRATVTDDDRRSISESVHELFERSGAFIKGDEPDEPDAPEPEDEPEGDPAAGKRESWARRVFGEH